MVSGSLGEVARVAMAEGEGQGAAGLARFAVALHRPIQPMLATPADDIAGAMAKLGTAAPMTHGMPMARGRRRHGDAPTARPHPAPGEHGLRVGVQIVEVAGVVGEMSDLRFCCRPARLLGDVSFSLPVQVADVSTPCPGFLDADAYKQVIVGVFHFQIAVVDIATPAFIIGRQVMFSRYRQKCAADVGGFRHITITATDTFFAVRGSFS